MKHDDIARVGVDDAKPWMLTASGAKLYFLEPTTHAVNLADICHHLGQICRFTGATNQFYSVAQHSAMVGVIVQKFLDDENVDRESVEYWDQILAALLHDAAEAYVNDLSSPLKSAIRGKYGWVESAIARKIFERYDIDWAYMNKTVKDADNQAILIERKYLMPHHIDWPAAPAQDLMFGKPDCIGPEKAGDLLKNTLRIALRKRNIFKAAALEAAQDEPEAT
jgi:hypothetical protein